MSTHNICFYGELEKIIPELSSNIPLFKSSQVSEVQCSLRVKKEIAVLQQIPESKLAKMSKNVLCDKCAKRRL